MFVEDIESRLKELEGSMFDASDAHCVGAILKTGINELRDARQQTSGTNMSKNRFLLVYQECPITDMLDEWPFRFNAKCK